MNSVERINRKEKKMKNQRSKNSGRCKINGFRYPAADTIRGRTSTICRSMACTLVTREPCTQADENTWLKYFGDKCAYCGDMATHLDHLFPLINGRLPTGYGTGPSNLVPCCGKCNQAKGNMTWQVFMDSDRCSHSDKNKEKRKEKIEMFQKEMPATRIDIDEVTKLKFEEIRNQFTKALNEAESELLKLKEQKMKGKNDV